MSGVQPLIDRLTPFPETDHAEFGEVDVPDVAAMAMQLRLVRPHDGEVAWQKMQPLSFSYHHRAINGADTARFVRAPGAQLEQADLFI